jgi:hypothetical protein
MRVAKVRVQVVPLLEEVVAAVRVDHDASDHDVRRIDVVAVDLDYNHSYIDHPQGVHTLGDDDEGLIHHNRYFHVLDQVAMDKAWRVVVAVVVLPCLVRRSQVHHNDVDLHNANDHVLDDVYLWIRMCHHMDHAVHRLMPKYVYVVRAIDQYLVRHHIGLYTW